MVPSSTKLFHQCFGLVIQFIRDWPTASRCRAHLRTIKDKFNLVVYFKLETQSSLRSINNLLVPDPLPLAQTSDDRFRWFMHIFFYSFQTWNYKSDLRCCSLGLVWWIVFNATLRQSLGFHNAPSYEASVMDESCCRVSLLNLVCNILGGLMTLRRQWRTLQSLV